MVGGYVIGISRYADEPTRLLVDEGKSSSRCLVRVEEGLESVSVGDNVWWQGSTLYWTPRHRWRSDVKLPKVGSSFGCACL